MSWKGKIFLGIFTIGGDSFISFKLVAPGSKVHLGDRITLKGQILAEEIKVGEDVVLSRELTGVKIARSEEIITDPDGGVYPINVLLVSLLPGADTSDAVKVAESINGRIVGVVSSINLYQIEVVTNTPGELEAKIQTIRQLNNPLVEGVLRNYVLSPF